MKSTFKKQLLNRMNYLKGHLEGVKKMIEKDAYCVDIIRQNLAVIAAINKVNQMVLENHLNTCVTTAIKSSKEKARQKVIKELLTVFRTRHEI